MSSVSVSVITPSYNQAVFIKDTLTSVAAQDYPNCEHTVIDGGSDDETLAILAEFEDENPSLRWISEEDEGHWDGINKGFERASGDIVGWLNSDDAYLFNDTITTVVEAFRKNPEADILYGNALTIDAENKVLGGTKTRDFSYDQLLKGCFLVQPAVFFRRHVVEQGKLRPGFEYALDYEYWLRLGQKFEFCQLDKFLAADRVHEERKSTSGASTQRKQSEKIRSEYGYQGGRDWGDIPIGDRIRSAVPRRLAATRDLIRLRNREDEAITLDWGSWPSLLRRQLLHPIVNL